MSAIDFESLLKECDLDENHLNSEIEREHFPEISRSLTDWKVLALKLPELSEGVVADIKANEGREEDKRLEFLKQLKQKLSFNATYGLLVRNLLEIERADDARNLCCHLKNLTGSKSDQGVASVLQFEKLKENDENLEKKFENVVEIVQASFLENEVNISKVVSSLKFIKCHEEKQMVKHQFRDLLQDQSLDNLFFTFSDIWDYIHPGLLEFIVERFGTTSDKDIVQEYKEDLKKYRRRVKLGEFVKIICEKPNPPLFNKELSIHVGEDWRRKTLQDLEDVRLQFADKTKCERFLFRALPRQSHFTIAFRMPSWIQLNLVELYPVLSTIGATKVYLNNDYIYECVPLKKEADDYSKKEKLQSFQSDLSKEMISHFLYISDSDFEDLIKNISACLKEKDVKAILALRWGRSVRGDPRDVLHHMFWEGDIMKFAPSSCQSIFKKIERMDVIPTIDDFYKNYTKRKPIITEDIIHREFESLNIFLKSIRHSLWDLEKDYKTDSLTSLSSELENIFYQAHNMNESIQNAILEFSEMQSIGEELMKLQKLEAEMTGEIQPHRLKYLETELSTIRGHLGCKKYQMEYQRTRKRERMLINPMSSFYRWNNKRTNMEAWLEKQETKIAELLGEPETRIMDELLEELEESTLGLLREWNRKRREEEDMEAELHQLKFKTSEQKVPRTQENPVESDDSGSMSGYSGLSSCYSSDDSPRLGQSRRVRRKHRRRPKFGHKDTQVKTAESKSTTATSIASVPSDTPLTKDTSHDNVA